jgi:hypothetical protein
MINNESYEIIIRKGYIYIKNYSDIKNISSSNISIMFNQIILDINGKNLMITKLDKYDLLIKGIVKRIEFIHEQY